MLHDIVTHQKRLTIRNDASFRSRSKASYVNMNSFALAVYWPHPCMYGLQFGLKVRDTPITRAISAALMLPPMVNSATISMIGLGSVRAATDSHA